MSTAISASPFSFHRHVRDRILPALAAVDGLTEQLPAIWQGFDILAGHDLDFDLRLPPPYPSNLCEQDCPIELAYTFGGQETCGVRYSYEPTCKKSFLKPRHALCRDRLKDLLRLSHTGAADPATVDEEVETFLELFQLALPRSVQLACGDDATACIAAIHHYQGRAPRIKAYFSVDWVDVRRAHDKATALVHAVFADDIRRKQATRFLELWPDTAGVRMVGVDFEPAHPLELKIYRSGDALHAEGFDALLSACGAGAAARAGLASFQDIFLDGDRDPARFNLVTLAPSLQDLPRLKLYIRPVELYDDAEALRRLERWYEAIDRADDFARVRAGLQAVGPLDILAQTRGFLNYVSVDPGPAGVTKTSVYFAPLILLSTLARRDPDLVAGLLQA